MSENRLNIKQMRKDYPFLKELWDLYDVFDKPVEGDYERVYDGICKLATISLDYDKEKYNDICMKLIRNLDPYCKMGKKCISYPDRCSKVNNWLYNSIEKKYLNNKRIIDRIFELSINIRSGINNYGCSYYSYDTQYKDPINIIYLKMFDDNIDVIKSTLENGREPNNSSAQMYLCKFVHLYRKMYSSYCSGTQTKTDKENKTCSILGTLRSSYNMYLFGKPGLSGKVPSLDANEHELLEICPPDNSELELLSQEDEISGSSTSSKISTTIGTMAGVSSVFAVLYKLTPAGRWMNNGLRGSGGRMNNSLYTNGQNELILDGLEHNNFNSYNIGYEAA